jgi:hypothetical protein
MTHQDYLELYTLLTIMKNYLGPIGNIINAVQNLGILIWLQMAILIVLVANLIVGCFRVR